MIPLDSSKGNLKYLDGQAIETLIDTYGKPDWTDTRYIKPQGYWTPGMGRPKIVADTPAVAQAMGWCVVFRVRFGGLTAFGGESIHPTECGWCSYPTSVLLIALDHAAWAGQCIEAELLTWKLSDGRRYVRSSGRDGQYDHPEWATFWRMSDVPSERSEANRIRNAAIVHAAGRSA